MRSKEDTTNRKDSKEDEILISKPTSVTSKSKRNKRGTTEQDLSNFADKVFGGPRCELHKRKYTESSKSSSSKKSTSKTEVKLENFEYKNVCLKTLLSIDASITKMLAICCTPGSLFRPFALALEWSGHGLPWFVVVLYVIFTTPLHDRSTLYIFYNYLFALILDCICVGLIKSIVQRPRPSYNHSKDMHVVVKADNFSFPSGHSSRITLMIYITLIFFKGFNLPTKIILVAWAFWVCLSRVMLGRHYLFDICAGASLAMVLGTLLERGLFLNDGIIYQVHRILRSFY